MDQQEISDNHEKLSAVLEENGELDRNPIYGPNWALVQPTQETLAARSESSYFHSDNKICEICKVEFNYGQPRHKNCGEHKLYCTCKNCDQVCEYIWGNNSGTTNGRIKKAIFNLDSVAIYCSKSCANVTVYESIRRKRTEDPEYEAEYIRIKQKVGKENIKKATAAYKKLWDNDSKFRESIRKKAVENMKIAHSALADLRNDPEWSAKMSKISVENAKHATAAYKELWNNDPQFRESMRKILAENVKIASAANKELWKDPKWAAKMSKINAENLKVARAARLEALIARFASANISFDGRSLSYSDSTSYQNVVGAIGLTGVYKGGKPGIPDSDIGTRFALTAGMRSDLGEEIRTFVSILAQPEKQISAADELALLNPPSNPDFGRWYDITHYYSDFEIILLASDVDPEDALATEAAWAIQNLALFRENPHGYWLP